MDKIEENIKLKIDTTVQDFYSNVYERKRPQVFSKSYIKKNLNSQIFLLKQDLRKEKNLERKMFKRIKSSEFLTHKGNIKKIRSENSIPLRIWKENISLYKKYSSFLKFLINERFLISRQIRSAIRENRKQIKGINLSSDPIDFKREKILLLINKLKEIEIEKNNQIHYINKIVFSLKSLEKYKQIADKDKKNKKFVLEINKTKKSLEILKSDDFFISLDQKYKNIIENGKNSKENLEKKSSSLKTNRKEGLKLEKINSKKVLKDQLILSSERIQVINDDIQELKKQRNSISTKLKNDKDFSKTFNFSSIESVKKYNESKRKIFFKSFYFNLKILKFWFLSLFFREYEHIKLSVLKDKYKYFKNLISDLSYDSDFYSKKEKMFSEFEVKFREKYEKDKNSLNNSGENIKKYQENKKLVLEDKKKLKKMIWDSRKAFISNLLDITKKFLKRKVKYEGFKNKRKAYRDIYKDAVRESILYNNYKSTKREIHQNKVKNKFDYKFLKKELKYQLEFIAKSTPIELKANIKFLHLFLDLVLPGLSSLFLKKYKKALILFIFSGFMYGLVLPLCFGYLSFGGNGIFGLFTLGKGIYFADSRVYIVEGVISLISLGIWFTFIIFNGLITYRIATLAEMGVRPNTWFASKRILQKFGLPYVISTPAWLFVIYISMMPVAATFIFAFTNYGGVHNPPATPLKYVGFDNFKLLFDSKLQLGSEFFGILWWTIQWTFFTSVVTIVLGFLLAYLTNHDRVKFKWLWRTIQILPWAIPGFLMILFWKFLVQAPSDISNGKVTDDAGFAWKIFSALGFISDTVKVNGVDRPNDVSRNVVFAKIFLVFLNAWLASAFMSLFYSGILQGIPKSLYEAARIDGAKTYRQVRHITIPLVLLAIAPIIIRQVLQNFNNFTLIWLFTNGGPYPQIASISGAGKTDIILSWIYKIVRFPTRLNNGVGFASVAIILVSIFTVTIGAVGSFRSKSVRREDF